MSETPELVRHWEAGETLPTERTNTYCDACGASVVSRGADGHYRAARATSGYTDPDTGVTHFWHQDHFPYYLRILGEGR
jgi:Arc/MetJ family transcription regulator